MSYSDLLPNEAQEELIQLADTQSRIEFRVGDIVGETLAWNMQNDKAISVMELYSAVGAFAGKSARTIRDYATVSAFYPPKLRESYSVLRFDHFRQAMTLGPDWEAALQWACEQVDELGRPASVDAMVAQFQPGVEQEPVEPEYPDTVLDEDGSELRVITLRGALLAVREILKTYDLDPSDQEQTEEALLVLEEVAQRVEAA